MHVQKNCVLLYLAPDYRAGTKSVAIVMQVTQISWANVWREISTSEIQYYLKTRRARRAILFAASG